MPENIPTPEQITSFLSVFEEKTKDLTREERLKIRNDIMLKDRFLGKSIKYIADKFQISDRQVRRIFEELDTESENWYNLLPKKYMLAIHRYNSEHIFEEIEKLKNLRAGSSEIKIKIEATNSIIDAYIKYEQMVAEGPTLTRQKEIVEQAEKIINENDLQKSSF